MLYYGYRLTECRSADDDVVLGEIALARPAWRQQGVDAPRQARRALLALARERRQSEPELELRIDEVWDGVVERWSDPAECCPGCSAPGSAWHWASDIEPEEIRGQVAHCEQCGYDGYEHYERERTEVRAAEQKRVNARWDAFYAGLGESEREAVDQAFALVFAPAAKSSASE